MAYTQKDNSGSLFKNDRKTSDNHPNAKGTAMIDGVEYYVSAWTRKDKNGNPWQSLAFTAKDDTRQSAPPDARASNSRAPDDLDDTIPF
jgi:hypothetical protein